MVYTHAKRRMHTCPQIPRFRWLRSALLSRRRLAAHAASLRVDSARKRGSIKRQLPALSCKGRGDVWSSLAMERCRFSPAASSWCALQLAHQWVPIVLSRVGISLHGQESHKAPTNKLVVMKRTARYCLAIHLLRLEVYWVCSALMERLQYLWRFLCLLWRSFLLIS